MINVELRKITPEYAAELLARNTRNRSLNKDRVKIFARMIREGEWKVTHQGIALNDDGELVDGQHRLSAVVEAGQPVEMYVATGMNDFALIDVGRPRTAADVLTIAGYTSANGLAAALRLFGSYDSGLPRPWNAMRKGQTPHDVEKLAVQHGEGMFPFIHMAGQISDRIQGSRAAYCAGLYIAARWSAKNGLSESFADWCMGLISGAALEAGDLRLALASWIGGGGRLIGATMRSEILMQLTLRAYHGYVADERLNKLLVREPAQWTYKLPGDKRVSD